MYVVVFGDTYGLEEIKVYSFLNVLSESRYVTMIAVTM